MVPNSLDVGTIEDTNNRSLGRQADLANLLDEIDDRSESNSNRQIKNHFPDNLKSNFSF